MKKEFKLDCPFCAPDECETLGLLLSSNKEYYLYTLLNDGTKKAFVCDSCKGVFFYDKMSDIWQISPATYDRFVEEGKIKDQLNED